ncbi:MAG: hypothetical protein ING44_08420 [Telmatospirillum sp.]|nr:hypothetical protein [Telmatospirillum sp.]
MSLIFGFEIPALARGDAFFAVDDYRKIVFRIDLGEAKTSVDLSHVAALFEVPARSRDARLLTLVPAALRYCRTLKAGQTLPSEAIDGRPSWDPKPHLVVRAVRRIGAAVGGPPLPLQSTPLETALQPAAEIMEEALEALVDWVGAFANPRKLDLVADDIVAIAVDVARVERLCRSIVDLQQDVGAIAKIAAARQNPWRSERARAVAIGLRDALVWSSAVAIELDAVASDPLRAFGNIDDFRARLWPKMAALRAFLLDFEPLRARLEAARAQASGPNDQELDEMQRVLAVRLPFDAGRFAWRKSDLSDFMDRPRMSSNRRLLASRRLLGSTGK